MTTNIELLEIMADFPWTGQVGVFSADNLPKELAKMQTFDIICNLSREKEEGTHFISISKRGPVIKYFDSLNLGLNAVSSINEFILSCNPEKILEFNKQIQSWDSSLCGLFALLFLLNENPLLEHYENVESFSKKALMRNDLICVKRLTMYISAEKI